MSQLREYIRRALLAILKFLLIFVFKIIGPPRILHYGQSINAAVLRAFGASVGRTGVSIHSPIVIHHAADGYARLSIGDGCMISGNIYLDLTARITLEKGVSLGPGVIIMTHNRYNYNAFLEERLAHTCGVKDVLIKEGAGIKAGVLIVHGITIGKNAVVAGGAVVNRDVPDNCLFAGVPARLQKEII